MCYEQYLDMHQIWVERKSLSENMFPDDGLSIIWNLVGESEVSELVVTNQMHFYFIPRFLGCKKNVGEMSMHIK